MTYRAGINAQFARQIGLEDAKPYPTLTCDVVGCGFQIEVKAYRGCMPGWLADGRAPKGWKRYPQPEDKPAQHTCPQCTAALKRGGVDMVVRGGK